MEARNLIFIIEILLCIFGLITFSLTIALYVKTGNINFSVFKRMSQNWSYGAVTKVSQGAGEVCPNFMSTLITHKWPGTDNGCLFRDRITFVKQEGCAKFSTIISAIDSIPYTVWRGVPLCAEKIPTMYLDLNVVEKNVNCPKDMKSCGFIDTMKNVLCVPTLSPCPYNYMEIIPDGQPLPSGFSFTQIPLKGANLILSNTNTEGKVISDLILSEDVPCADPQYQNFKFPLFPLEKYFEKDKCYKELGDKTYDTDYEVKDMYPYYDVYSENTILKSMGQIPTFNNTYSIELKASARQMRLYSKNYIGIKTQCIKDLQAMNFTSKLVFELSDMHDKTEGSSNLLLNSVITGGVAIGIMLIYDAASLIMSCTEGCGDEHSTVRVSFMIVHEILKFVMFVIACVIVARYCGLANTYEFLIDNNCCDTNLNSLMQSYKDSIASVQVTAVVTLIFGLINSLLYMSSFVIFCFLHK
jgi:hypothetical protein